ncbi:helicase-related protein [Marinobacter sp. tcs-11]|uniref:helicase-related protein n=1 Tax=Marinobacter sp. tcs-11 TaxID=1742860 RepID=UPI00257D0B9E|nr:helicase-related protein [Marinobacter sp. tcs-11]
MATPTLPWPNLESYNLIAQVAQDKAGKSVLLLRPSNTQEDESVSVKRAELLQTKLEDIAIKVGTQRLGAKIMRGHINVLLGPMIDTPAKMSAFLQKLYPRAPLMNLTAEQVRQFEFIREQAKKIQQAEDVTADSPFNLESLKAALPGDLDVWVPESKRSLILYTHDNTDEPILHTRTVENLTNKQAFELIQDGLKIYWEAGKTDKIGVIQERRSALENQWKEVGNDYFKLALLDLETEVLNEWEIEAKKRNTDLIEQRPWGLNDLIALRDSLKERLDGQGQVMDDRLVKKVADIENQIAEIRIAQVSVEGSEERDTVRDNVQEKEGFQEDDRLSEADVVATLGVNFAGEALYEDGNGVRFKIERGMRIKEKVALVPTRGGYESRKTERQLDWLTMDEALEAPFSGLTLAMRVRGMYEAVPESQKLSNGWAGLVVNHGAHTDSVAVRALETEAGALRLLSLTVNPLADGAEPTINAQLLKVTSDSRILADGVPRQARDETLKFWASLGLSLPENAPQAARERFEAVTVNVTVNEQENTDDRTDATAGGPGTDRQSDGGSSEVPANTGGISSGVPAGGRSGGVPRSGGSVAGGNGDDVPASVASGEQSGQPAGTVVDQGGERGNTQERDGATGDQRGTQTHAEMAVRGPGSGGGNGRDGQSEHDDSGAGDRHPDNPGVGTAGGDNAGVSGRPSATPENPLATEPTDDRGAGRPGGSQAGVSDGADGESGESEAAGTGALPGSGGTAGSPAGQPSDDHPAPTDSADAEEHEIHAGSGEDSTADADGDGSGTPAGRVDWEQFADEQTAGSAKGPQPLRGEPELEGRTASERLRDNLAAIRLLGTLEKDGSEPTYEERQQLARFSGFGGIHAHMFRTYGTAPKYVLEASRTVSEMVRDGLLESRELDSMRSTILNAHYTHSGLIGPMWEALDRMGLPLNRVLEPSCGIGNFKAFMPESVAPKVKSFTGIELDRYTARLAQAAHPDARILQSGFERTSFPDSFFDTVISNIPFGDYGMFDPEHPERRTTIHNAFFLKGLDKVRPGGVVAFITSAYVLDGKDTAVRKEIMDRAHVMGTYRLPAGTFEKTTGTEVVTDVIFLQKKGNFTPSYEPINILDTKSVSAPLTGSAQEIAGEVYQPGELMDGFTINQAYIDQPERLLGELAVVSSQHGPKLSVLGGGSVEEQRERVSAAFETLPTNVSDDQHQTVTAEDIQQFLASNSQAATDLSELPGALSIRGEQIYVRTIRPDGSIGDEPNTKFPKNMQKRGVAAIQAMIALSELLDAETKGELSDAELDDLRAATRQHFDNWEAVEKKAKPAFSKKAWSEITKDPRAQRMAFKETYDEESRELNRPDILFQRTARPLNEQPSQAKDLPDALAISLAYTGMISETYMISLLKEVDPEITVTKVRQQLVEQELAFIDPLTNKMVERAVYLSGNLAPKIEACRNVLEAAPEFQKNLDALEASLPAPLTASQIKVSPDAFWLPEDVMKEFLKHLGIPIEGSWGVRPYFDDVERHWRLEPSATSGKPSMAAIARENDHVLKSRWGTERRHALDLLGNLFTNTIPKVQDPIPGTEPTRYVINVEETLKAQAKHDEIKDAFDRWIFKDPQRAQSLVDLYNERFNTTVLYEPNGDHLVFPGMAESWVPRKHQSDFIWRAVSGKNSMTAHVVGAGKTLQLIGSAIRGKQMGRWRKPMVVVPNHMLEQFCNDAQSIYPNAKVLMMSAADARAANRPGFAAKCAMGDWDLVVCTHSVFEKITVPNEFEALIVERELAKLRAALDNEETKKTPKEVEKAIKRLEARLARTMDEINKGNENILNMEQIGIDFIGVDEAHYYKNLMPDTASAIPGVTNASSKRAMNMLIKTQYLRELHGDCYGVMMATGTPISNSIVECYTFTRMLRPDLLEEMGIYNFNDWMGLFGEIKHGMEMKPEGGGYQMKSRLSRFKNIPELVKMIRTFIDFKTREDLNLPSPEIVTELVSSDQTEFMEMFMKYIEARAKDVRNRQDSSDRAGLIAKAIREGLHRANDKTALNDAQDEVDPDDVETPKDDILLTIATDGRKASLDPRLIHPKFEDNSESKVNKCVRNLVSIYRKFDEQKALQMVFCDFSSPTGKGIFNVYDDVREKLIKAGIPEDEIAFIHSAKTDADKEEMFAKCRSGEIRFLLGSTQKMGVGTNVQERLVALHELDPPWKPADIEQRLGRMDRQGNSFETAYSYRYVTVDSFDLFMWETLNRKLKMVNQAMRRPEDCAREIDEEIEPGYEDILSITTGNPAIREFMDARQKLDKLKRMLDSHTDAQADIGGQIIKAEKKIERIEEYLKLKTEERELVRNNTPMALHIDRPVPKLCEGPTSIVGGLKSLGGALEVLIDQCPKYRITDIGTFGGLTVQVNRMGISSAVQVQRLDGTHEALYKVNDATDMYGQEEDDDTVDHFYEAAKTLVSYVRKIGKDNGIPKTQATLETAKANLASLTEDHGKPFAYEEELQATRRRFEELTQMVGDEVNEDKQLDPLPLFKFAQAINKQTGSHQPLVSYARTIADTSGSLMTKWAADDTEDDDEDLELALSYDDDPSDGPGDGVA